MKLEKVLISGFRSIRDTQELRIDGAVTVLIGANDHGKTNLLYAIQRLNDKFSFKEEDRNWDIEDDRFPEVRWYFELSDNELLSIPRGDQSLTPADDSPAQAAPEEAKSPQSTGSEQVQLTISLGKSIVFTRSGLSGVVTVDMPGYELTKDQKKHLLSIRPRIELFDLPEKISDDVPADKIEDPSFEFMKGLFMKARLWDKRATIFTQTPKTTRQLDEASERLTEILREEWEQGRNLEWKFQHVVGTNHIRILIKDPSVSSTYVRPSLRSAGFTNFFILSLTLHARTASQQARSYIYLFDEPGTALHPIAKINLQRVFESLAERTQILYTTHSIFLVNKNVPVRNRVVKKTTEGTVIDKKPYVGNWKAVRDALGILLSHNFLISDRTLLVEGPSDGIYILAILSYLNRSGAIDIDLNGFSIVDAGNRRNYVAMAKLMLDEGRTVIALLDNDQNGRLAYDELKKIASQFIEEKKLVIHLLPEHCSIEDILPHHELLADAIIDVANDLTSKSVLTFAEGVKNETMKTKLQDALSKKPSDRTLGAVLNEVTLSFFANKQPLSKLAIATAYNDKLEAIPITSQTKPATSILSEIKKLSNELQLVAKKAEKQILEQEAASSK